MLLSTPEHLLAFALSVVALACTPGLAVTALASNTARYGARTGLHMALGFFLARLSQCLVVLAFLPYIAGFMESTYEWIKLLGAAYLIWIGYGVLASASEATKVMTTKRGRCKQVFCGYALSWSNPKALLFASIILPRFVDAPAAQTGQQILLLGGIWATLTLLVEVIYIMFAGRLVSGGGLASRATCYMAGAVLVGAGTWLAFADGVPSLEYAAIGESIAALPVETTTWEEPLSY